MTPAERQTALERISIRNSLDNLRSFPDIKSLEEEGEIEPARRLVRYLHRRAVGNGRENPRFHQA